MISKCGLVVTTINDGDFLYSYADQLLREDYGESCDMIVIPDRKTPAKLFKVCNEIKKKGVRILCPTVEEQDDYLKKLGAIRRIIPYNSDNRRNIGYLMALEKRCDFLISIDDDNYCIEKEPFFKEHSVVCHGEISAEAVNSSNGWYNICDLMIMNPTRVYPRGFPYHARFKNPEISFISKKGSVHLNAGLWLQDPDIDAIAWLNGKARAESFKGKSLLLGDNTWSPVNTQNTAIYKDAVSSYYFVKMGYPIKGMTIDRYGDIFSGYFCQKCIRHLGYHVRIGTPIARHIRNTHNYLNDLTQELGAIWLIEDIAGWLQETRLEGATYEEAYLSLADQLDNAVEKFSGFIWDKLSRKYFHEIAKCMRIWIKSVNRINGI